jgi:hypothetical protein
MTPDDFPPGDASAAEPGSDPSGHEVPDTRPKT